MIFFKKISKFLPNISFLWRPERSISVSAIIVLLKELGQLPEVCLIEATTN